MPALGPRGEGWVGLQVILFAIVGVGGAAALGASPPSIPGDAARLAIGGLAIVAGGAVAALAVLGLGSSLSPFPKPVDDSSLVTSGVYGSVRHPIYSGILLAGLGWALVSASVVALAGTFLLFALFDAKSRREEAWLAARHPEYAAYRARTRRFVPRLY